MNKQREALELALEAIKNPLSFNAIRHKAICEEIREALAEPEQKPVAVVTSQTGDPAITMSWHHEPALPIGTKLYAAPPARKPLTDEQIDELDLPPNGCTMRELVRAIERAHGIGGEE